MRPVTRHLVAAICAVWSAFQPPPAQAQNSSLIRLTDREDLFGWEAVGRVEIARVGYCTGVLIATDLVLTAAHCVFDPRSGDPLPADAFGFRAGLRDGKAIAERRVAQVVAHPGFVPGRKVSLENIRVDAALLKLNTPVPASDAAPFALYQGAQTGTRVSVVSYGQGRDAALSWQRDCGLLGRRNAVMAFDCDVAHGSSGAPVFVREGQRTRILSLISSGATDDRHVISFGMDLPPVVATLKRRLRAGGAMRAEPTEVRRLRVGERTGAAGAKFVRPNGG